MTALPRRRARGDPSAAALGGLTLALLASLACAAAATPPLTLNVSGKAVNDQLMHLAAFTDDPAERCCSVTRILFTRAWSAVLPALLPLPPPPLPLPPLPLPSTEAATPTTCMPRAISESCWSRSPFPEILACAANGVGAWGLGLAIAWAADHDPRSPHP